MPAFTLPSPQLTAIVAYVMALRSPVADHPISGDSAAGEAYFFGDGRCSSCHMVAAHGGVLGPDLSNLARVQKLSRIQATLDDPSAEITPGFRVVSVRLADGRAIRGLAKNESNYDLQLEDLSGALHSRDQARHRGGDSRNGVDHAAASCTPGPDARPARVSQPAVDRTDNTNGRSCAWQRQRPAVSRDRLAQGRGLADVSWCTDRQPIQRAP